MRWILAALFVVTGLAQVPDPALGKQRFESQCALCHGQTGGGGRGPSLRRPVLPRAPDNNALRKVISEGIQPEMPGAWQLSAHEVESVAAYVRTLGRLEPEIVPGSETKGQAVYRNKGCANCHMIRGIGSGLGPELTDIGVKRSAAYLRESLVSPEADVPKGFQMVEAITSTGSAISGIRLSEDPFTVQFKDLAGRFHSYRKSELRELRKLEGKSPMPSYQRSLTDEELTDLIAYLASQRGNP